MSGIHLPNIRILIWLNSTMEFLFMVTRVSSYYYFFFLDYAIYIIQHLKHDGIIRTIAYMIYYNYTICCCHKLGITYSLFSKDNRSSDSIATSSELS